MLLKLEWIFILTGLTGVFHNKKQVATTEIEMVIKLFAINRSLLRRLKLLSNLLLLTGRSYGAYIFLKNYVFTFNNFFSSERANYL